MGRKPKSDAIRRAHEQSQAVVMNPCELQMPDLVANNELMRECWEWIVDGSGQFRMQDVPQLTMLTYWWATARQCMTNLEASNGGIITEVENSFGDKKQAPDIKTMQLATNQIRQLEAELGISPLARQRMGLMKMATVHLAASVPDRIFKMLDEHNGN